MPGDLNALTNAIEEAKVSLGVAKVRAGFHKLSGTQQEIKRAIAGLNSVLFEIDRKTESEFEPFRGQPAK